MVERLNAAQWAERGIADVHAESDDEQVALIETLLAIGVPEAELVGQEDLVSVVANHALVPTADIAFDEAAAQAGLDPEMAARMWRALGLVDVGETMPDALGAAEADALRFLADNMALVGTDGVLEMTRVLGLTIDRVADAVGSVLRVGFELPRWDVGRAEIARGYHELVTTQFPRLVGLLEVAMRRHLLLRGSRQWMPDATGSVVTVDAAVGFADLVGFTEFSARAEPAELAAALDAFDDVMAEVLRLHGAFLVKLIGDEAMFVAEDLAGGLAAAEALVDAGRANALIGEMRIGLAAGPVITRAGDYFGVVVNTAARLVVRAEPGEIVVADGADGGTALAPDGRRETLDLKGFTRPVAVTRIRRRRRPSA